MMNFQDLSLLQLVQDVLREDISKNQLFSIIFGPSKKSHSFGPKMAYIPQFGPEKHEFEVRFLIRLDLIGVLESGYGKNWILLKKSYLGFP